ncbi:LysR family transcriptional regulator [Nocardiopsis alba]|uniref:LysR family transcriptional regulator n=1 Tax=Nocardiopsis alba TaxID=53437 RepID=A0A7K2ISF7_9ACTN|nr:LysR family transcriptional regulator [Nocardiopsis alba]MYR32853.1 LysR family transcriptional regulator [Nocardiopsis alba]
MELQQLRYVIAVAEEANFTRAAARCFVVQSALSHRIKTLERELGFDLFARTSRRVELTAAGEAFLPEARAALEAAERAVADASEAVGRVRGRLNVGVIPTVTAVDVPAVLGLFHRAHPEVRVTLRMGGSDALVEEIVRGDVDVAFLGLPESLEPRGVAWRHLGSDHLVAVLAAEHPLAERAELRLTDLEGETFADFTAGTPGRAQSDLAFDGAGVRRDVAFESMSADLIVDLVRQNLAVTLLASRCAPRERGLVVLPVVDGPSRAEYLSWSDFNPGPAARAFLELVDEAPSA